MIFEGCFVLKHFIILFIFEYIKPELKMLKKMSVVTMSGRHSGDLEESARVKNVVQGQTLSFVLLLFCFFFFCFCFTFFFIGDGGKANVFGE